MKDNTSDITIVFLFTVDQNLQYVSVVSVSIVSCLSLELFLPMAINLCMENLLAKRKKLCTDCAVQ